MVSGSANETAPAVGRLAGKVAVITGGTAGIGLATARLFVNEGAHVYILGRDAQRLQAALDSIGHAVTGVRGDAADLADLDRLYDCVGRGHGHVDVLFASAGFGGEFARIDQVTPEHFDKVMGVNLRGTLFTVQKALPLFSEGGAIVLNASMASVKGFAAAGVYNASKAGVRSFARTWTVELKDRGIRVNAISPGSIATQALDSMSGDALRRFVARIPRGRIGQADEVAQAVLFLASSESSFVSGIELFVDGGVTQI